MSLGRRLLVLLLAIQLIRAVLYAVLIPLWQNPTSWCTSSTSAPRRARGDSLDLLLEGTVSYRFVAALVGAAGGARADLPDLRREIATGPAPVREIRRLPIPTTSGCSLTELNQPPLYYMVARDPRVLSGRSTARPTPSVSIVMSRPRRARLPPPASWCRTGRGSRRRPLTFTPQYTSLSGAITNDKLVELAFAGVFVLTV